jgi:hypothetical protein
LDDLLAQLFMLPGRFRVKERWWRLMAAKTSKWRGVWLGEMIRSSGNLDSAPLIATAASSDAFKLWKEPQNFAIGVRATLAITIFLEVIFVVDKNRITKKGRNKWLAILIKNF